MTRKLAGMADSSSLQVVEERRSSVSPLGNGRDTHVEETDSLSDFEDFTDEYPSLKTLDGVEESGERVRTAVPFDASKVSVFVTGEWCKSRQFCTDAGSHDYVSARSVRLSVSVRPRN